MRNRGEKSGSGSRCWQDLFSREFYLQAHPPRAVTQAFLPQNLMEAGPGFRVLLTGAEFEVQGSGDTERPREVAIPSVLPFLVSLLS